ncbi:MAG: nuclear transport factor 2 family protein [Candidatus Thiodiazotropha sp.]
MKLEALIEWYQGLTPARLDEVGTLYSEQAEFQDPFNKVRGVAAIRGIFQHMFDTTESPGFEVLERQVDGDTAWITWRFSCRLRRRAIAVEGSSRLRFGADGRVDSHRDYWDALDIFQQLPLLSTIVTIMKRRLATPLDDPGA